MSTYLRSTYLRSNSLWSKSLLVAGAAFAAASLIGCGVAVSPTANPTPSTPATLTVRAARGTVTGGQQPVAGVNLQLYQAGTTGYGSTATPLGLPTQTTSNGNFNLPSYTCTAGSQVYLVGTGGMPYSTVTNANLALMVGLGTCGGTDLNNFIDVNELTTVASVWALAPFMTGITNIGTSPTNAAGLANAFAVINELVNTANGTLSGPTLPADATLPMTEINTLGDILAQCVNSAGGVAGDGSGCGDLFHLAPNAAGNVYPTDTITAAMNIAQNPGRNATGLNQLQLANPVFTPAIDANAQVNDWTLAITYIGGGLNAPTSVATDAAGSVWVTNSGNASVTKLDYLGNAISTASGFTTGGFNNPSAIAIDTGGNAWIANMGSNTITELNSVGAPASGTPYSSNGLDSPRSIAIDGSGNVWVANSAGSNTVSAFTSSGSSLTSSPFSGAGTNAPVSVAITPK
jgi:DNA-binding beta-propeller fold protein YncE